jgi:hypothetical protein
MAEEEEKDETVQPEVDTSKKFTQADVDRIAQREHAKLKDLKAELEALKTGKDETLDKYEKVINDLVADMSKEIPPPVLKLLGKLTPLERLEYLSDPENGIVFEKKEFPISKAKAKGSQEFKPSTIEKFV